MDYNHIYNKDHLKSLCRGLYDKALGCFHKKVPFVRESRGGDFRGKTIFVIRRGGNVGLFSYFLTALSGMKYAFDRGWIPVVDMQTLPNIYLDKNEVGINNAWEYYFEQPCGLSLTDIEAANDVIVTKDFDWPDIPPADIDFLKGSDGRLLYWREMVKRHIKFSSNVREVLDKSESELFFDGLEGVLGVFIRGSDYSRLHPLNHTVQPTVERAVADAKKLMSEYGARKIFLVTEDRAVVDAFRCAFQGRLVMKEQNFVEYTGGYIGECRPAVIRERERYLSGLDYLVNILLLCKCPYLLASRASGSIAAAIFCEKENLSRYYDLGIYTRWGTSGGSKEGIS